MTLHFDLIDHPSTLQALSETLANESIIAFDTEFIRENTYIPQLALIQIGTKTDSWLIDVLKLSAQQMQPLLQIMQAPQILKVLHSAHGDQECLFHSYAITASPTLDTFEAASLLGMGDSLSLRDLIQSQIGINIGKSHARTDWLHRPLSEELKKYALSDVQYLVKIGENILQGLEKIGRKDWALELSAYYENPQLYSDNSAELAAKLAKGGRISARSYAILKGLIAWREQRARSLNIPRRRVADDETLFHIANARPSSVEQLSKFRGLNSGEIKREGNKLLSIIRTQLEIPNEDLASAPKATIPDAVQARLVDLLATYLRVLGEQLSVAPRHLLTTQDLRKIVLENLLDPKQWIERGICSARVTELIGSELCSMLEGKRALSIEAGKIKIQKI